MRKIHRGDVLLVAGVFTFAAISVVGLLHLQDIIGAEEFRIMTLRLLAIGGMCALAAMAGVSLGRLEDPHEASAYHADDTRLS